MAESIERKKILVTYFSLVLFSAFLISLRLDNKVKIIKNVIFYVFSSSPKHLDNILKQSQGVAKRIHDMILVHKENLRLKERIQEFIEKETYFKKLRLENERLKEILKYESNLSYKSQIVARMIGRKPSNWYNTIIINKGTKDGISEDDIVIAYQQGQEGVVGRIVESSYSSAKVLLVTDTNSAIAAYIRRNKEDGLMEGQNKEDLMMKYLSSKADVKVDDILVTSGYGGIFPAEIVIGKVKSIFSGKHEENFKKALISPSINFSQISDVLVIKR